MNNKLIKMGMKFSEMKYYRQGPATLVQATPPRLTNWLGFMSSELSGTRQF